MKAKILNLYILNLSLIIFSIKTMAQSQIIITKHTSIIAPDERTKPIAQILKTYLDKAFGSSFEINSKIDSHASKIFLNISNPKDKTLTESEFAINSDSKSIYLTAPNDKYLRYAVYTLLEIWGVRKFTAQDTYIPILERAVFAKNYSKIYSPSFEYRALFYPDCYDPDFRDWHKLDWQIDDFGIWGHSFYKFVPAKKYFEINPKLFALYRKKRNPESLCMTNDTVVDLVVQNMKKIIIENPNAQFFSISQNDDLVYCECRECTALNKKYGGPQGSLYYFLNKVAVHFPTTKITTLAYLQTFKPPINLKIEPNIYTFFCPIDLDRGKVLTLGRSDSFIRTLTNWSKTASHLYLWDYTVQFSNYLSPFPNIQTFKNYKVYKDFNIKGVFTQGYADIPGDFYELRQYILAKLLWDVDIDIQATIADFLRGYYGKAAPFVDQYLNLLMLSQTKDNRYLGIYSGPVQARKTFLNPISMAEYEHLLEKAAVVVKNDPKLSLRISKLQLALEYVRIEQAKFYGKRQYGMFVFNKDGVKEVKKGLTEMVLNFTNKCNDFGIYELSEGGLSPNEYYMEWLTIAKNVTSHLGENLATNYITPPEKQFKNKENDGLVDGNRGYKDFNINWVGWYGKNPEFEILTKKIKFSLLKITFLEDQRHWIFFPKSIKIYGFKGDKWILLQEKIGDAIIENPEVTTKTWEFTDPRFGNYSKIKIFVENQTALPSWRERKGKKPMVMIDETELYK